jgi:membrane protein DedA with SNARE-associated domain
MNSIIYPYVRHVHAGLRWLLLSALLASLIMAVYSITRKKDLDRSGRLFARMTVYFAHLQLLAGIVLYVISPFVIFNSGAMESPVLRFYMLEHSSAMLISIILITVGYVRMKRAVSPTQSARTFFWYYLISFLIILGMIPWPFMHYGGQWL